VRVARAVVDRPPPARRQAALPREEGNPWTPSNRCGRHAGGGGGRPPHPVGVRGGAANRWRGRRGRHRPEGPTWWRPPVVTREPRRRGRGQKQPLLPSVGSRGMQGGGTPHHRPLPPSTVNRRADDAARGAAQRRSEQTGETDRWKQARDDQREGRGQDEGERGRVGGWWQRRWAERRGSSVAWNKMDGSLGSVRCLRPYRPSDRRARPPRQATDTSCSR